MSHGGLAFRNIIQTHCTHATLNEFDETISQHLHFFGSAMIKPVVRLLLIATFLAPIPTFAAADQPHIQFCWTIGKFDHTVYYAEVENREDRQASFEALLEISGIDHHAVKCTTTDVASFRLSRAALVQDWLEFEVVNTTLLSDLDY